MSISKNNIFEAIELLSNPQSTKRRSGAKSLRKLRVQEAGLPLLQALKKEMQDSRTWETQYQMIAALGECNFQDALPYLLELVKKHFEATMVYVALGDAIVRLSRKFDDDAEIMMMLLNTGNKMLIMGGIQAIAMLRMKPNANILASVISYAQSTYSKDNRDWSIIWVLRAAPGWQGPLVEEFLQKCSKISFEQNQQIYTATKLALAGKYHK